MFLHQFLQNIVPTILETPIQLLPPEHSASFMSRSTILGILPSSRHLITPHAGLLLLGFRLRAIQLNAHSRHALKSGSLSFSTLSTRLNTHASSPISISRKKPTASLPANASSISSPESMEPRLSLTFTCTVTDCGERSTHQFTKRAYEKGIVIVQCPGCKNR